MKKFGLMVLCLSRFAITDLRVPNMLTDEEGTWNELHAKTKNA